MRVGLFGTLAELRRLVAVYGRDARVVDVVAGERGLRVFVYGLVDPGTGDVRYIGKTVRGMERVREHSMPSFLRREQTHKARWIRKLAGIGQRPELRILEVCDEGNLDACEIEWIAFARAAGWPLTNLTNGGEGALHPAPEVIEKRRASTVGRKLSPDTKARISESNRIAHASAETRERMRVVIAKSKAPEAIDRLRRSLTGKKASDETRERLRRRKFPPKSAATRARLSASLIGRPMDEGTREKIRQSLLARTEPRRCPRLTPEAIAEIRRLAAAGTSRADIAAAVATSASSVARVLRSGT